MSENTRDYKNYFGRTGAPFVILNKFEVAENSLKFTFDGWASIAAFEAGAAPLTFMRREFLLDGERLDAFLADHEKAIIFLKEKSLELADADPKTWAVEFFSLHSANRVFNIILRRAKDDGSEKSEPNCGEQPERSRRVETQSGTDFDEIVAREQELVGAILTVAWTHGAQMDEFLWNLTEV